jgi:alanyl-tRNA synthetase
VTHKVFWDDPYRTSLDARVAMVHGCDVVLDRTIFYAESGGQESDHGTIGGHPVQSASKSGHDIVYALPEGHDLVAGLPVIVQIDWARRYSLMRLHFAAELVLELVVRRWPGVEKIGAHIAQDKARIDFALGETVSSHLPGLTQQAQAIIDADTPIVSAFSDAAAERRYWEVPGFARVPCGGTHLRRTGEVGSIRLKRKNVGAGKERVEIFVS